MASSVDEFLNRYIYRLDSRGHNLRKKNLTIPKDRREISEGVMMKK